MYICHYAVSFDADTADTDDHDHHHDNYNHDNHHNGHQVCDDAWHHYAVSVSPQGVQLTLDGELWQVRMVTYIIVIMIIIIIIRRRRRTQK